MARKGQERRGKKKHDGSRMVAGTVQQSTGSGSLAPGGVAMTMGQKPGMSLLQSAMGPALLPRLGQNLVLTPTLRHGSPEDIEANVGATLAKIRAELLLRK